MYVNNVYELFSQNYEKTPDKQFLFYYDRIYTFKDMYKEVDHAAKVLRDNGVKKGDRVAVYLSNSPEYYITSYAIARLGAIGIPSNNFLKEYEISMNMNDCGAEYLISSPIYTAVVQKIQGMVPTLKKTFAYTETEFSSININTAEIKDTSEIVTKVGRDDVSILIYTSGTTGKPKGVMLTHNNLIEDAVSFSSVIQLEHADRWLAVLPLFHSYAYLVNIIEPLILGNSIVVLDSVLETAKAYYVEMLKELKPTVFCAVPQVFSSMARKKIMDNIPFTRCICGGAPLPVDTIVNFKKTYNIPVIEGYGLSEASPVVAFNPLTKQKPGTVGVALKDVEAKVADENGNELPRNTPGELWVKGANVMIGYWNNPDETKRALVDGWLRTGDIAKMDEEGFIAIVDRIKDLIIVKGINVYPREVEEVLHNNESIISASVVGIPDKDGSEMIFAFVKVDPEKPLSEADVKAYLKPLIANFKMPKHVAIVDEIPVNSNGKIIKRELREIAKQMLEK